MGGKGGSKGKAAAPKVVYDYSGIEKGMRLQVLSEDDATWYAADVLTVSTAKAKSKAPVKVSYKGYTGYDEWVGGDRIRSKALKTTTEEVTAKGGPAKIISVYAREILDSRGNPTVEVELKTKDGVFRADVPSGASTGENEAVELRDGGSRYLGKGVEQAVKNVIDVIGPKIKGKDARNVKALDKLMIDLDGTPNKSKLGANAILGVSMAACRAGAAANGEPLYKFLNKMAGKPKMVMPVPCFNAINGGVHAGNYLPFQEFFLIPLGATTFKEGMQMGAETYHTLKGLIKAEYGIDSTAVGDEGGFAPKISDPEDALKLLVKAIDKAGYTGKIKVGSDPAASETFDKTDSKYNLDFKMPAKDQSAKNKKTGADLVEWWVDKVEKYPVALLEDPFDENDFDSHAALTAKIGDKIEIVGDDLYCTNPTIVQKGIEKKATNAMLLKVNQIGSISEAIKAYKLCVDNSWGVFCSHRSGETEDHFLADLTVALGTGHLKTGAPCRSERNCKYNQLLRIEEELKAPYAGADFRKSESFESVASCKRHK
jgi:enolase